MASVRIEISKKTFLPDQQDCIPSGWQKFTSTKRAELMDELYDYFAMVPHNAEEAAERRSMLGGLSFTWTTDTEGFHAFLYECPFCGLHFDQCFCEERPTTLGGVLMLDTIRWFLYLNFLYFGLFFEDTDCACTLWDNMCIVFDTIFLIKMRALGFIQTRYGIEHLTIRRGGPRTAHGFLCLFADTLETELHPFFVYSRLVEDKLTESDGILLNAVTLRWGHAFASKEKHSEDVENLAREEEKV